MPGITMFTSGIGKSVATRAAAKGASAELVALRGEASFSLNIERKESINKKIYIAGG